MKFEITGAKLARPADLVDLSSATSAQRTGSSWWAEDGRLEIPFDRDLTPAEVVAVTALLTAPTDVTAELRDRVETYLAYESPTTADNTAVLRSLARLALELLDHQ